MANTSFIPASERHAAATDAAGVGGKGKGVSGEGIGKSGEEREGLGYEER